MARAIAQGLIGEPKFVALVGFIGYVRRFAQDIPSWWFDPKTSGRGWLGMMGSHVIDQVRAEIPRVRLAERHHLAGVGEGRRGR